MTQLKTLYNTLKNQQQKILNDLSTEQDERFKDYLSQTMDTTVSIREIEEVSAAKSTSRKKSAPTIEPTTPISANT